MSDVLQFLSALDTSAKTTTADLQAVTAAAANATAASSDGGITGGAGTTGSQMGGVGGPDRSGEGQAGISDGPLRPKIKSTTVSGANAGLYPDLIAALKSLGGRT
jgi:hypothetical protein